MNDRSIATTEAWRRADWPSRPCLASPWGDVFDRLTILRLKSTRIHDAPARANVLRELAEVEALVGDPADYPLGLHDLVVELGTVNAALWGIEDDIRACERAGRFDAGFIALARSVYRENDRRAGLKQRISQLLGSALIEEKFYGGDPVA